MFAVLLLFLTTPLSFAQSNLGRKFRVVLFNSEVKSDDDDQPDDPPELHLCAPRATNVRITFPDMSVMQLVLPAATDTVVALKFDWLVGADDVGAVRQKSTLIESDDSVFVVAGLVPLDEGDAYAPLPLDRWGSTYRPMSAAGTMWAAIVAGYDSTRVTISSWCGTLTRTVVLNAGQVYLYADSNMPCEPLIQGSRPIGVLGCGYEKDGIPMGFKPNYHDNTNWTEQFLPVEAWGTEFYSMPFGTLPDSLGATTNRGEILHVIARDNATWITIDGTLTRLVDAGHFLEFPVTGFHHVTATKPVCVMQYRKSCLVSPDADSVCGPRLATVPAVSYYATDVWFATPHSVELSSGVIDMLDLVYPAACVEGIALDGVPLSGVNWRPVGEHHEYLGTRITISRGLHHLTGRLPFGAIVYGIDAQRGADAYAFTPAYWTPAAHVAADSSVTVTNVLPEQSLGAVACISTIDSVVVIPNATYEPLQIDSIRFSGPDSAAFTLLPVWFPITIAAHDTVQLPIRFDAAHAFASHAIARAYSGGVCSYCLVVPLTASRDSAAIVVTPQSIDFGDVLACDSSQVGTTVLVRNVGQVPAVISPAAYYGAKGFRRNTSQHIPLGPGDSVRIPVVYASSDTGVQSGLLIIRTPCNDSIVIALRARGVIPGFAVDDVRFDAVCPGDSVRAAAIVRNTSGMPITIAAVDAPPPFQARPPTLPRRLGVGEAMPVDIVYTPVVDGSDTAQLTVVGGACGATSAATLLGERGRPQVFAHDVEFGSVCVGASASRVLELRNLGNATARVDSLAIGNAFAVNTLFPVLIGAGETLRVVLDFAPRAPGDVIDFVNIFASPCASRAMAMVHGMGVRASVAARGASLDTVVAGGIVDTAIVITNTGVQPVTLDTISVPACAACAFTALLPSGRSIAAGDSLRIPVRYHPTKIGADTIVVCAVIRSPCYDSLCAQVTGAARAPVFPSVRVCITPSAQAVVGDTVALQCEVLDSISALIDSFTVDVSYDPSALQWRGGRSFMCGARFDEPAAGFLRVSATPCASSPRPVFQLTFLALVTRADTAHTMVRIDSIRFVPPIAVGAGCAADVTIMPLCGLRGVGFVGTTRIAAIYPNPFSGSTTMTIAVPHELRVRTTLRVLDVMGRTIADLTGRLHAAPATNDGVSVDFVAERIPSGVYECVLENSDTRVVRVIHIMR